MEQLLERTKPIKEITLGEIRESHDSLGVIHLASSSRLEPIVEEGGWSNSRGGYFEIASLQPHELVNLPRGESSGSYN